MGAIEFLEEYKRECRDIRIPKGLQPDFELVSCICEKEDRACYLLRKKTDREKYFLKIRDVQEGNDTFLLERERLHKLSELFPEDYEEAYYGRESGKEYLLRRYIEGVNLEEYRDKCPMRSAGEVLGLALRLCDIVEPLHGLEPPLIHRDIKPQNLIIDRQGRLHLIDFETTRVYQQGKSKDTCFFGTEDTAAPEQYGYAQTDRRTDIYAIGKVIEFLYYGDYARESGLSYGRTGESRVRAIIGKATAFDPKDRYPDVGKLRGSIQKALKQLDMGRYSRRLKVIAVAEALTAALLLGGVAVVFTADRGDGMAEQEVGGEENPSETLGSSEAEKPADMADASAEGEFPAEGLLLDGILCSLGQEELTAEDLSRVTRLAIIGDQVYGTDAGTEDLAGMVEYQGFAEGLTRGEIRDLSALRSMENLQEVFLCAQDISDISALEGLPIQELYLCSNNITDLSVVESLPELRTLYVADNPLRVMPDLSACSGLLSVNLNGNRFTDLDFLVGSGVGELSIREIQVVTGDYSVLTELEGLYSLKTDVQEQGLLDVLPSLTGLQELALWRYMGRDLNIVKDFGNLETLFLSGEVDSLVGLEGKTSLRNLYMNHSAVTDLSVIRELPNLRNLKISELQIEDYTPLLDCTGLQWLAVDEEQKKLVEEMDPEHSYTVEVDTW